MAETALPKDGSVTQGDFFALFADRFEPELNTGCLLWSGSTSSAGYGTLNWRGRTRLAHRCAYEDVHGIGSADGLIVRHKCDTPACGEPTHLVGGSYQDNYDDARERGRIRNLNGEGLNRGWLTSEIVLEMRKLAADGSRLIDISRKYNCPFMTVSSLVRGLTWAHLPNAIPNKGKRRDLES